jgi:hypothetical protein
LDRHRKVIRPLKAKLLGERMTALTKSGLCLLALVFAASAYASDLVVLKPHAFDVHRPASQR